MLSTAVYGEFITEWCPGCGNFDILECLKQALAAEGLAPERLLLVSGIGQAAKAPYYIRANVFNGLHGRALPAAIGAKLANPELTVIVESGDGCLYGEGGNHFLAAIRRNSDLTVLAHNNGVYGLTKGQASPTGTEHLHLPSQPFGMYNRPFNPIATAIAQGAGFVARSFSGDTANLPALIRQAIAYRGFALIDILTPCVSFNKYNTFSWYKKHCVPLPPGYDPSDKAGAYAQADRWGEEIPVGVIYRREPGPIMEDSFPMLSKGPLASQKVDMDALRAVQERFR